jgi:hypothetical protein
MAVSFDSHVSGIVRSVNDKGLKLEGHDSWLNLSKWAVDCVLPERGQHVVCTLDKAGFLRAVQASDGSDIVVPRTAAPGAASAQNKDRTITRLAVLKAAVERAKDRPDVSTVDILRIAEAFERWVLRPYDGDELDEAF